MKEKSKDQAYPSILSAQDTHTHITHTPFGVKPNASQKTSERFTLRLFPLGSAERQTPQTRIGARTGGNLNLCMCVSDTHSLARRLDHTQEETRRHPKPFI